MIKYSLTATQNEFVDYINKKIKENNRIIFYKSDGHFGGEYALYRTFKKIEIFTLTELKNKKKNHIFFKILNGLAAVVSLIILKGKKIDPSNASKIFIENVENIYLGIDKKIEYLKYLQVKKFSRLKYKKPKNIIIVKDNDINCQDDIRCINLLKKYIINKKITKTLLLIVDNMESPLSIKNILTPKRIPNYSLTENDLINIAYNYNFEYVDGIYKNIDLIKKFGINFLIDNYSYFILLASKNINVDNYYNKLEWLINSIINEHNIVKENSEQLFKVLEFASFFEYSFSKLDISKYNNDELKSDNLTIAKDISFICELQNLNLPKYYFDKDIFKKFFNKKYTYDLYPNPEEIYNYFVTNHPFSYIPLLKLIQIDNSITNYSNHLSLIVIAYYYNNEMRGLSNHQELMCFSSNDSLACKIISIYEEFKRREIGSFNTNIVTEIICLLKASSLNNIASCAAYCILLQVLKENYKVFSKFNFADILAQLKSNILKIKEDEANTYQLYWKLYFMGQYIAFSLEDEDTDMKSSRLFLNKINKMRNNINLTKFINDYNLRELDRIDLLAFSLGNENAKSILFDLYINSEKSTVIKELARINYSAILLEYKQYNEAEKILKRFDENFLLNINLDTYCAYLNNLYVSQLNNQSLSFHKFKSKMQELLEKKMSLNDQLVIENNLYAACLIYGNFREQETERLMKIIEIGNPYNKFFAVHNLLSYYYQQKDKLNFNKIYDMVEIPKLLKEDTTFFLTKFSLMKKDLYQQSLLEKSAYSNSMSEIYKDLFLFSSIERWFE